MPDYSKPEYVVDDYAVIRARMDELGLGRSSPTQAPERDPRGSAVAKKQTYDKRYGICDFCQYKRMECDGGCGDWGI